MSSLLLRKISPVGILLLALSVLLSTTGSWAQEEEMATGVVFEDTNGDGIRDPEERGIEGVSVSNGVDVVQTDPDGNYSLPVTDETILFVTKPSGYAVPVNGALLPQFYYIHHLEGTSEDLNLRYPGIEPTGDLPESIDFPLQSKQEPSQFEVILFSDTQPQTQAELDYIRDDVVTELIGSEAQFGMTTGDILFDDLSMFPRYNQIIAQIGIPWYNVPGNHELNFLSPDDAYSLETFKRFYGPPYYSFAVGDAHFVVLDNVNYLGQDAGRDQPTYRGGGQYEGRIGETQLEWLRNDLQFVPKDKLIFIAMHIPLQTYLDPEEASINTADKEALFEVIQDYPNLYSVAGHTHTTEHHYFEAEDGFEGESEAFHHHVLATVSGSWWSGPLDDRGIPVAEQRDGTPNGYHILEVDGSQASVRFKGANQPEDYQMRIMIDGDFHHHRQEALRDYRPGELLDGDLSADQVPAAEVIVNLFDGGPNSTVEFTIADQTVEMAKVEGRFDPYVNELFLRHEEVKKPWVKAEPVSHLWVADLPDDLTPGIYTLEVRAVDEFEREFHGHKVIEITGNGTPTGFALNE